MSKTLTIEHLQLRCATSSEWSTKNPVLSKAEAGYESDTGQLKIGDGATAWNSLNYYTPTNASKLANARTITISGDAAGTVAFDGSANVTINATLAASGVSAGTYTKLTVDAKGRAVSGAALSVTDIPALTLAKITDAGTAAAKDVGTASGNVPVLDSNGKLAESVLPALSVVDVFTASSTSAMTALDAQKGDMCIVGSDTYILSASPASTLSNWIKIPHPTDVVTSVNGKTGAITLTTSDIAEGSNKYYTEARATSNFETNIANTNVGDLANGANVCLDTDTYILNCGGA